MLFDALPPVWAGAHLASDAGQVRTVFAAMVMAPVSLVAKRGMKARSARATFAPTRTPSTTAIHTPPDLARTRH